MVLIVQKLNQYPSKHNQILFTIQNHKIRRISGHPQVHSWFINILRKKYTLCKLGQNMQFYTINRI